MTSTLANQPRREGYLKKEGGQHKTWRKRWCVLAHTSGTLFYHAKKGGFERKDIAKILWRNKTRNLQK